MKIMTRKDSLELALKDCVAALHLLRDNQNGCPLPKYEKEWNKAMRLTRLALLRAEELTRKPTMKYQQMTDASLRRAAKQAIRNLKYPDVLASAVSAGHKGKSECNVQVFVRACRFSESLLKRRGMTGGLLELETPDVRRKNAQDFFSDLIMELSKGHRWNKAQRYKFNRVAKFLEG